MTSTDRGLPFHPPVTLGDRVGCVMLDQVKSISRERLVSPHRETLSTTDVEMVKFALRQIIDVS